MQWNCPHCGISLAIPAEPPGAGWSFSRCYKCGGFALIRKTEVNVIKVDKAPPGERVILPEASGTPSSGLISENATQKLLKHAEKEAKPAQNWAQDPLHPQNQRKSVAPNSRPTAFPQPLPEIPGALQQARKLPIGIMISGALAIASGVFLFLQSQSLWQKVHEASIPTSPLAANHVAPEVKAEIVDHVQQSAMAPMTTPVLPRVSPQQALTVRVRNNKANIHSGPGMQFSIIGTANAANRYTVIDWNNRWFKLLLKNGIARNNTGPETDHDAGPETGHETGWIRNDLVQVVSEDQTIPVQ